MNNHGFKDLLVYKKAFQLACTIFETTLKFPKEEKYSLTDQIRRSSRSVCANLAEAYRKRNYPKHYLLKLTDCQGENSETLVWLDFSFKCHYIMEEEYICLVDLNNEVGKLIAYMMNNPDKFGVAPL
jgi:four helix bundle protein